MKISILMPTYNDCESITETLNSVIEQTYQNYEIIIVDDGSTDQTNMVIKKFVKSHKLENKISYYYQENKDQLNALKNASKHVTGDYIYVLHSDDLLADKTTLEKMIDYITKHNEYDAIISDLTLINNKCEKIGIHKTKKYIYKNYIIPLQLLFLGRNLFVDVTLIKRESFFSKFYENYLNWNGPFWLDCDEPSILKVKKVDFPFIKYRVFEGNYINNEIGLLNVFNGEIRVATSLMKHYNIINYKLQYYIYRLCCKLHLNYIPIYTKKETKNKYNVMKFIYDKRFSNCEYNKYQFYSALLNFYKNNNNRTIEITSLPKKIYYGSDMRTFHKKMLNNELEQFYYDFFDEMSNGFNRLIVNEGDKKKIVTILRFLCIYQYVEVIEKK